ncbi:MAG: SgcJ/EcaC family oxidoreductase [Candidatus Sulfotelmatobacter sp.]
MNYLRLLALALAAAIAAMPEPSSDEIPIRNIIQEEITAWNAGDAAAYARHFSEDGTFTNVRGQFFTGRQAFIDKHDYVFICLQGSVSRKHAQAGHCFSEVRPT